MLYQRIFVPVDNSSPSDLALTEAVRLGKSLGATLILAHSVDTTPQSHGRTELIDNAGMTQPLVEAGRDLLQGAQTRARKEGVASEMLLVQSRGQPVPQALLKAARDAAADVIVMGTHGRTGIMHLLLGSVAEGVLRQADLPILLVRGD
ncbi:MAG: universal stress protein [Paludibacterium sp.]|uniref:universal stress protein n=1 Tax=Paludibacterium sp. TaxID=1917523 RepID=UPI0025CE26D8|nr:universal stress protein [Paludibacterium sp.]MBV8047441.1 universal stress protein [Paludibacterium sp.]MBV8649214.1 universal stress protein [Paludibacterium sp.]